MAEFPKFPLWTDAYLSDTYHLSTTEHGAYLLLLIAMWRAKEHRLPSDDRSMAKFARLTPGQWSRIKPTIMPFFQEENGFVTQGRLTDEANAVRQHSRMQSDKQKARWRKEKEKADTAVSPEAYRTDTPYPYPLKEEEQYACAREGFFDHVLVAAGYNPADTRPAHWMPPKAEIEVRAWLDLPGMTEDLVITHVRESTKHKGRADGPKAFTNGLRALSAQVTSPPLQPIANGHGGPPPARNTKIDVGAALRAAAAEIDKGRSE